MDSVVNLCTSYIVEKVDKIKDVAIGKYPPYQYQLNPID
jgi:hypothetical protein